MCDDLRDNGALPQELALDMIPVIRRTAYRLAKRLPRHVDLDDLISAGMVAVVNAYRRFDASLGIEFRIYAAPHIRGAMIDELRTWDPLSRKLRAHVNRAAAAKHVLESRFGRAVTEAEIAGELGVSLAEYQTRTAGAATRAQESLDAPQRDGSAWEVADPHGTPADERLGQEQARLAARRALSALPERLRHVLDLYYGDERTLRDIGTLLGVSESRVCQLQSEAIRTMRAHVTWNDLRGLLRRRRLFAGMDPETLPGIVEAA
jgi:RNA polymerase sigma factor FliA